METPFHEIRRRDRILDDARAAKLLETAEYGFLSLGAGADGYAYGVPINFAYEPETQTLWFHCAPEGHKLDNLRLNDKVSFCVVGCTQPQPEKFTTLYESVIAFGRARIASTDDERRHALRLLVRKYCPGLETTGESYMARSLPRTETFSIRVERITAKAKK